MQQQHTDDAVTVLHVANQIHSSDHPGLLPLLDNHGKRSVHSERLRGENAGKSQSCMVSNVRIGKRARCMESTAAEDEPGHSTLPPALP